MTREQEMFLKILSDHIHRIPTTEFPEEIDWDVLQKMARIHNLKGIVYIQCREYLSSCPQLAFCLKILKNGFISEICLYTCRQQDFQEFEHILTKENIRFLPMKGKIFAKYYPVPQLRTMGDMDILIHSEDRQKSHQVLLQSGYLCSSRSSAVWNYNRDLIQYELHDHMIYHSMANEIDYQTYFEQVWDFSKVVEGTTEYEMDENFHFLYLMAHTAKHMVSRGSGLRPFLDMVFMTQQAGKGMDWDWIAGQLEELKLLDFTKTCFALCNRWFGVEMPFLSGELEEDFYQEITEKVFLDGIFGHANEENQTGKLTMEVHRSGGQYWRSSFRVILRKLFPPYKTMRYASHYPFLDGRPYLLPAAWLYRFGYCICHRFHDSIKMLTEPFTKRRAVEEREEKIKKLGL